MDLKHYCDPTSKITDLDQENRLRKNVMESTGKECKKYSKIEIFVDDAKRKQNKSL